MNEFLIDKQLLRKSFSRAAAGYDAAAIVQREVCKRLMERLDFIKLQPARILDAGSGTGFGTRSLGERYKDANIIALDIAVGMLQTAKGTSGWWQKLFSGTKQSFLCADIEALPFCQQAFDMVWSNLTLQWCNELPDTIKGLHRVTRNDGLLMFSTFGPDTLKELRSAFAGVDGYTHINRFADMHDIGDMLAAAGFADPVMEMEKITLTYNDVKSVMHDLKNIGAHNLPAGRALGMMGREKWSRIVKNYEAFRQDDKLPATFEIVYGHAWRVPQKKTDDGRAIVRTNFKL